MGIFSKPAAPGSYKELEERLLRLDGGRRYRFAQRCGRIELDESDSEIMIAECQRQADMFMRLGSDPEYFNRLRVHLHCPATRVIHWDAHEQLRVLSATCFNPMKREAA